jgi:hypothetical protein
MTLWINSRRIVMIGLVGMGLLIGVLRLSGPSEDLYPVEGDSAKYHSIASGFAQLYAHPLGSLQLWISKSASQQDLQRLGLDSWVLQHAPAYTATLGLFYLLPGDDGAAGRFATVLIFALGAALLFLLGLELFGFWPGLIAAVVYLFWPAHWTYAPAILTEVPMAVAGLFAAYAMVKTGGSDRPLRWALGGAAVSLIVLRRPPSVRRDPLDSLPKRWWIGRRAGRGSSNAAPFESPGGMTVGVAAFLSGLPAICESAEISARLALVYRGDYVPDRGWRASESAMR